MKIESSTLYFVSCQSEWNHTQAIVRFFLRFPLSQNMAYPNQIQYRPECLSLVHLFVQIVFHGNSAPRGDLIYSHSMTACLNNDKNRTLADFPVLSNTLLNSTGELATGPVWAFFSSTSCDCLKPVSDSHSMLLYYPGGCNRQTIYSDLLPYKK